MKLFSKGIVFRGMVVLATVAAASSAQAATFDFDDPTPIPTITNNGPNTFTFNVSGLSDVTNVSVTLFGLSHSWLGDLQLSLQGPTGTSAILLHSPGSFGDWENFSNTTITFDDAGADMDLDGANSGNNTVVPDGTYRPYNTATSTPFTSLFAFNGLDPNGTWTLTVEDDAGGFSGSLTGGTRLTLDASPSVVPLPAGVVLGLSGVAALGAVGALRRRRRG